MNIITIVAKVIGVILLLLSVSFILSGRIWLKRITYLFNPKLSWETFENIDEILVDKKRLSINSEDLAYWYFRLNGFLTIQNLVVHQNSGSQQETEIDIIAARFPYRTELPENENPMQD